MTFEGKKPVTTVDEMKALDKKWRGRGTPGTATYVKKPSSEGGHYTYKEKCKILSTYISTGNMALTARLCAIPEITLRSWKTKPWWNEMLDELIIQDKVETNKNLKRISDQALAVVADRLIDGNHQYDQKSGEIIRVPVNVRDAHRIAVDMLGAQNEIEERIESLSHRTEQTVGNDALAKLAEQLAKFAKGETKKSKELDITDAVVIVSETNSEGN
jgi:hypothetical protein